MERTKKPVLLLVSNPQTSKNETLQTSDLFSVNVFKNTVDKFDRALGLPERASLHPDRQIASVVMSVAAHSAFVAGLKDRVQPGMLDGSNDRFKLNLTGHSIGEMASLIEAGVCDIPTMAWMLNERERITQNPLEAGLRQMVVFMGVNADKIEANLHHFSRKYAGEVEFHMANLNTPRQVVLALKVLRGEVTTAIDNLSQFIPEIKDPLGKPLFPNFRFHPLLANGFHTAMMGLEEAIYIPTIAPKLTSENFQPPIKKTVYSPTLPGWVNTLDQSFDVTRHILTKKVQFTKTMREFGKMPDLLAMVTADVIGTTPNMIKGNGIKVPIFNIVDKATLEESIEVAAGLILGGH